MSDWGKLNIPDEVPEEWGRPEFTPPNTGATGKPEESPDEVLDGPVLDGPVPGEPETGLGAENSRGADGRVHQEFTPRNWDFVPHNWSSGSTGSRQTKSSGASSSYKFGRTRLGGTSATKFQPEATFGLVAVNMVIMAATKIYSPIVYYLGFSWIWASDRPWTLITSAFVHANLLHLVFNVLALLMLGMALEPIYGHLRLLVIYLVSALGGSVAYALSTFGPEAPGILADHNLYSVLVGASGAVFGLLGAGLANQRREGLNDRALWVLVGINLVYGFISPGIAWEGHLGGFFTGLACGAIILNARQNRQKSARYETIGILALTVFLVIVAAIKVSSLMKLL